MPLFELGQVLCTNGIVDKIPHTEVAASLVFHCNGLWGQICPDDAQQNNYAIVSSQRILSSYVSKMGVTYWVITEGDRSVTTVLLPEEY